MSHADLSAAVGIEEPVIVPVGGEWKEVSPTLRIVSGDSLEQREAGEADLPSLALLAILLRQNARLLVAEVLSCSLEHMI